MTGQLDNPVQAIAGIFKFRELGYSIYGPSKDELEVLAKEWLAAEPGYDFLHVRQCGEGQIGIEFRYWLPSGDKQADFVHKKTDQLKRKFGNDLVAWDIAPATVIK